jgi:regulatory protein
MNPVRNKNSDNSADSRDAKRISNGMKITSIKQQVKNPERVSIFIDSKYTFSLSLDELVAHKLKNNQELSEAEIKKYKKISEDGKMKARALAWVLGRPHSTREFSDYMFRKKADPDLTGQLIQEFTTKKYLNDIAFTEWFIELKARAGKSNRQIQAELFKKGINRQIADEAMQGQENDELERLKALVTKKLKSSRYKNDPLKLKQYLLRQGFSYDSINSLLTDRNT